MYGVTKGVASVTRHLGQPRSGWDNMRKRRERSFGDCQIFHAQVFLHGAEMDRKTLRQKNFRDEEGGYHHKERKGERAWQKNGVKKINTDGGADSLSPQSLPDCPRCEASV